MQLLELVDRAAVVLARDDIPQHCQPLVRNPLLLRNLLLELVAEAHRLVVFHEVAFAFQMLLYQFLDLIAALVVLRHAS